MALGLALELDLQEYETFLATANFALNPSDMFDTVVKYCVTQKIYDVMQVDSLLFQMDLPCFNEKKKKKCKKIKESPNVRPADMRFKL